MSSLPDERLALALHLLPPGARADVQIALTLREVGGLTTPADRCRVPRARADDGAAARARQAEDPDGGNPVPRAGRRDAAGPARGGATRDLPHLQRGLRREQRARRSCAATSAPRRSGSRSSLCVLMPDEPEAFGLLALMLLQDSRRDARLSPDGELVLLADQDRSLWDAALDRRGPADARRAPRRCGGPGPYQLQAAIAAGHAQGSDPTTIAARLRGAAPPRPGRRWHGSTTPSRSRSRVTSSGASASSTRSRGSTGTGTTTRRGPTSCAGSGGRTRPRRVPARCRAHRRRARAARSSSDALSETAAEPPE